MHKTVIAFAALLGIISNIAHARYDGPDKRLPDMILAELEVTDESLAACLLKDGRPIEVPQCARWQKSLAEVRTEIVEAEAKSEAQGRALAEAQAALAAEQQAKSERLAAQNRAIAAQRAIDAEKHKAEMAAQSARFAADDAAQARRDAALRKACGKDYMAPRIGMPIKRALQCLGEFRVSGQVNRKDGVLTTYVNDDAMLQAIDGKLVGWVEY